MKFRTLNSIELLVGSVHLYINSFTYNKVISYTWRHIGIIICRWNRDILATFYYQAHEKCLWCNIISHEEVSQNVLSHVSAADGIYFMGYYAVLQISCMVYWCDFHPKFLWHAFSLFKQRMQTVAHESRVKHRGQVTTHKGTCSN